jgi:hypothetical protein
VTAARRLLMSLAVALLILLTTAAAAAAQQLSVKGTTVTEGNTASFTVTLDVAQLVTVSVHVEAGSDTATSGEDFPGRDETLTFAPGQTSKQFRVPTIEDTIDEPTERFDVGLDDAVGATIANGSASGGITDDDPAPRLSVGDATATEGNAGTTPASFTARLSAPSGFTVTAHYATARGTAASGSDFTAASGTVSFRPGDTAQTISVPVIGDTADEPDETFSLVLSAPDHATLGDATASGRIVDDDEPPPPPGPPAAVVAPLTTAAPAATTQPAALAPLSSRPTAAAQVGAIAARLGRLAAGGSGAAVRRALREIRNAQRDFVAAHLAGQATGGCRFADLYTPAESVGVEVTRARSGSLAARRARLDRALRAEARLARALRRCGGPRTAAAVGALEGWLDTLVAENRVNRAVVRGLHRALRGVMGSVTERVTGCSFAAIAWPLEQAAVHLAAAQAGSVRSALRHAAAARAWDATLARALAGCGG